MAELLLRKGYEVHGLIRWASNLTPEHIVNIFSETLEQSEGRLLLHYGDLADVHRLCQLMREIQPDEVYNLVAQSHVGHSFEAPLYISDIVALGAQRMLQALISEKPDARFYQASSSEMFGHVREIPQTETTPFSPCSPYACSKVFAHWVTVNARESHQIFACSGILFNHESPRRGTRFVTRKITMGLASILAGQQDKIYLGNLDAERDWGYAPEYVYGMWQMLQQEQPEDFLLATGETHSVRAFLDYCCELVGLDSEQVYAVNPRYFRPREVNQLVGDAFKARQKLNWCPQTQFHELAKLMLAADLESVGLNPANYGLKHSADKVFRLQFCKDHTAAA